MKRPAYQGVVAYEFQLVAAGIYEGALFWWALEALSDGGWARGDRLRGCWRVFAALTHRWKVAAQSSGRRGILLAPQPFRSIRRREFFHRPWRHTVARRNVASGGFPDLFGFQAEARAKQIGGPVKERPRTLTPKKPRRRLGHGDARAEGRRGGF